MRQSDTYPTIASPRAGRSPAFEMAVLIEVPKVRAPRTRQAGMTSSCDRWRQPTLRRHRPRRRLRRGVRLAGWSLLATVLILGGGALGWASLARRAVNLPAWSELAKAGDGNRDDMTRLIGSSRAFVVPATSSIDTSAVVVKSIEPAFGAPIADAEVSVVFPGYVLPDDTLEEPANEGS
jgi:hypothetical protein